MAKKVALSILCLAATAAVPLTAVSAAPRQTASQDQAIASATKASSPTRTTARSSTPKSTSPRRHRSRSRERVYTVTPEMIASMTKEQEEKDRRSNSYVSSDDRPFVGFAPADNAVVGVGLWRMPKADRHDPNRNNPIRGSKARTTRAAAIGMQVAF